MLGWSFPVLQDCFEHLEALGDLARLNGSASDAGQVADRTSLLDGSRQHLGPQCFNLLLQKINNVLNGLQTASRQLGPSLQLPVIKKRFETLNPSSGHV